MSISQINQWLRIALNQLDKDRTTLRNMYTDFDHFPQPAKTALHDMLYNLGEGEIAL